MEKCKACEEAVKKYNLDKERTLWYYSLPRDMERWSVWSEKSYGIEGLDINFRDNRLHLYLKKVNNTLMEQELGFCRTSIACKVQGFSIKEEAIEAYNKALKEEYESNLL